MYQTFTKNKCVYRDLWRNAFDFDSLFLGTFLNLSKDIGIFHENQKQTKQNRINHIPKLPTNSNTFDEMKCSTFKDANFVILFFISLAPTNGHI